MIQASEFLNPAAERGYTFVTGVPCSFLKPIINYAIQYENFDYVGAASEGEAVGIAAGAHLAGRKTMVMCQNSGLGNLVNPLTSLNWSFRIPSLLIVTLRGEPGRKDEPQHELMGVITGKLLETMNVKWEYFPEEASEVAAALDRAEAHMAAASLPFAFVMRDGSVDAYPLKKPRPSTAGERASAPEGRFSQAPDRRMGRAEAIGIARETLGPEMPVVATTGKIGRELFHLGDRRNQIYVVGSMGCASGIALGIRRCIEGPVTCLDGDGAALMKLGAFATIGHYRPDGFLHIVLDNEAHESTGGQSTVSSTVDFASIALACGYSRAYRADTAEGLKAALEAASPSDGPVLIHAKVKVGSIEKLGRPTMTPPQVKERFMEFLAGRTAPAGRPVAA
jgi:phosphonopyruvate decarboxylase